MSNVDIRSIRTLEFCDGFTTRSIFLSDCRVVIGDGMCHILMYYLFTVCKVCLLDLLTHEMGLGAAESMGRFVW